MATLSTLPTLRSARRLGEALTPAALRGLEGEPLLGFLREQRWFGAKGQSGLQARLRDVIPIFGGDIDAAIVRVDVTNGVGATYQLPLLVRPGDLRTLDDGALAAVEAGEERGLMVDAPRDDAFRARLLVALRDRERYEAAGCRWYAESYDAPLPPPGTSSRVLGGEQSNTSILYGEQAMLKIYRRLTAGPNPEAEISKFLAARGFPYIPALLGLVRIDGADGSETVAGIAQEFVVSGGDGWTYAKRRIRDLVILPDAKRGGRSAFLDDCRRLGEVSGTLHRELAADPTDSAFAPEPVTAADAERWSADIRRQADASIALLEQSVAGGRIVAHAAEDARAVLAEVRSLCDRSEAFLRSLGAAGGARIRHHGDYHLGQVLRRQSGDYVILDFEGEPARPLAERRQRHSPLRDVAGMLRSFAYAAAVTLKEEMAGRRDAAVEEEARRLTEEMQQAFRAGYFAAAPPAPILPATPAARDGLLAVFEIEKALYELAYELNNRPHWVDIPLAGLRALLREAPRSAVAPSGR
jgi:trehalose synthase-fused probable maltokinase